jgi:hypothetical protein
VGAGSKKKEKKTGWGSYPRECGQGQGCQAGGRQTDTDEERFRRWLGIPIGSASAEQVQEPGRGGCLSCAVSEPGPGPPFAPGPGKARQGKAEQGRQSVSGNVTHDAGPDACTSTTGTCTACFAPYGVTVARRAGSWCVDLYGSMYESMYEEVGGLQHRWRGVVYANR